MNDPADNAAAAGAPGPLVLGGRTYLVSQPSIAQTATLSSVLRKRARKDTPLGRVVNDPAFAKLSAQAQTACAVEVAKLQGSGAVAADPFDLVDEMLDPATLSFAVWLLARPNHDGLTLEEVQPHVNEGNAAEVFVALSEATGMLGLAEKNSAGRRSSPTPGTPAASSTPS
jgi:hypothetical protein